MNIKTISKDKAIGGVSRRRRIRGRLAALFVITGLLLRLLAPAASLNTYAAILWPEASAQAKAQSAYGPWITAEALRGDGLQQAVPEQILKYTGEKLLLPETLAQLFDADYYLVVYPELKESLGLSGRPGALSEQERETLYRHFVTAGLAESRKCSPWLDVAAYRAGHIDLENAFGGNWDAYVKHYFTLGQKEGRNSFADAADLKVQSALLALETIGSAGTASLNGENAAVTGYAPALLRTLREETQDSAGSSSKGSGDAGNSGDSGRGAAENPADARPNSNSGARPNSNSGSRPDSDSNPDPNSTPGGPDSADPSVPPQDTEQEEGDGEGGEKETPRLINRLARDSITGYTLYREPDAGTAQYIDNGSFSGWFYPETYQDIMASSELKSERRDYTMMIYLCGTDLEDYNRAGATKDLMNLLVTGYDLDKVNVLVLAGGTMQWSADCMQELNNNVKCCLYYLDPNGIGQGTGTQTDLEGDALRQKSNMNNVLTADTEESTGSLRLLANFGQVDMGDSELLLGFMDTAYDLFPADHYWLSLWNHGEGATSGICFSDPVKKKSAIYEGVEILGDGLSLARLEEALSASSICRNNGALDILTMEACMMSGIEVAYNLSPYVDYLVASEELTAEENAYGLYLRDFGKDGSVPETSVLARQTARAYLISRDGYMDIPVTNACLDLTGLRDYDARMETFGNAMAELLDNSRTSDSTFRAVSAAAARAVSVGHENSVGWDYVDMYGFLSVLKVYLEAEHLTLSKEGDTENAAAVRAAEDAVDALYEPLFILYRGLKYRALFSHDLDADAYGAQSIDLSTAGISEEGHWGALDYGSLCGISLYLPFKKSVSRLYLDEAVFPGYARFLEKYSAMLDQTGPVQFKEALDALKNDYSGIFSGIEVSPYIWSEPDGADGTPGAVHKDIRVRILFNTENGSEAAAGLDPVIAFEKTVSRYKVDVLRHEDAVPVDSEGNPAGEERGIDIVIAKSGNQIPNMWISGDVSLSGSGEESGLIADSSGITVNAGLLDMIAYYAAGFTAGEDDAPGTEDDVWCMDWGTPDDRIWAYDYSDYYQDDDDSISFNVSLIKSIALDGRVFYTEEGSAEQSSDAALLFVHENEDSDIYLYLGAVVITEIPDDMPEYRAVKIGSEGDKVQTTAISLYHYMIEDNSVRRVEDSYRLNSPVFLVAEAGSLPAVIKVKPAAQAEDDLLHPEYNRYGVEISSTDTSRSAYLPGAEAGEDAQGWMDPQVYEQNTMRIGSPAELLAQNAGEGLKAAVQTEIVTDGQDSRMRTGTENRETSDTPDSETKSGETADALNETTESTESADPTGCAAENSKSADTLSEVTENSESVDTVSGEAASGEYTDALNETAESTESADPTGCAAENSETAETVSGEAPSSESVDTTD